ncbi:MAG: bifunctional transaldolase/phosoglucose isomerase [Pseudolabrys sp.]
MNPLIKLQQHGQSVWLDFLDRGFTAKGGLKRLVDEDGVRGVTSNPAIFEKAVGGSTEYDEGVRNLLAAGDRSATDLFEALAVEDIQNAAAVLRPVYDQTKGADGFVSLEVSPYLAMDAEGTIAEARRLWAQCDRPNVMIKVPATKPGLVAIRTLLSDGININITLLFAQAVYREVVEAYLTGLEAFAAKGGDISRVASVASFFVSRIDSVVDAQLDKAIAAAGSAQAKQDLAALQGKTAIANAKLAYRDYQRLFSGARWDKLKAKGARPQRLLWASTGTKNKAYSDVLYVAELIGPDTVNTMPTGTLEAFRDHGEVADTLTQNVDEAERVLAAVAKAGISLDDITAKLEQDGVRLFADAADGLFGAVARKRAKVLGDTIDPQTLTLPADLAEKVKQRTETWRAQGLVRRLWAHDASVWTGADEARWLGWLDSVGQAQQQLDLYRRLASDIRSAGFTHAVLLGMGGSSLGPEVLARTFMPQAGFPKLLTLDSTDPEQIAAIEKAIDLGKTLFIVSSKSGSTIEPNMLLAYFFAAVVSKIGKADAGKHFIAVTDPNSQLEAVAKRDGFRQIVHGEPSIGGRYSVLSPFGLVPASVAGFNVEKLLQAAATMLRSCGADVPPADNPAVQLGLALGEAALAGRDKVTIVAASTLGSFGAWAEQLIAESTGKNGKALIPLEGEPIAALGTYGKDRFFINLRLGAVSGAPDAALAALTQAGHPLADISLKQPEQIAQEFVRLELATAVAGAVLGINPFDQPDVEASKVKARALTTALERDGKLPEQTPVFSANGIALFTDEANAVALRAAGAGNTVESWLKAHFGRVKAGDYTAILAYIAQNAETEGRLQKLRLALRDRHHVATCVGFGPRFLHSTGQAYKGGPNSGVFLEITADDPNDLAIPGAKISFGQLKAAQATGDFEVLTERGRRALRVHLRGGAAKGLPELEVALTRALD